MTNRRPLVSIIIPAFNAAHYLEETFSSIAAQDCDDWEAIIADDESTDDTPFVVAGLSKLHPGRITYLRLRRSGSAGARNAALELARGEFILPLDADDLIRPNTLSEMTAALRDNPRAGYAYCGVENFGWSPGKSRSWYPGIATPSRHLWENTCVMTSMWRRRFLEEGVRFKELLFEDWEFWIQIESRDGEGVYVPLPLFRYRQHMRGHTSRRRFLHHLGHFEIARENPALYPSWFVHRAKRALAHHPACLELESIVFVPSPASPDWRSPGAELTERARYFADRGHFCAFIGQFSADEDPPDGVALIQMGRPPTTADLIHQLNCLGPRVIAYVERNETERRPFLRCENVDLLLDLRRPEHDPEAVLRAGRLRGDERSKSNERRTQVFEYFESDEPLARITPSCATARLALPEHSLHGNPSEPCEQVSALIHPDSAEADYPSGCVVVRCTRKSVGGMLNEWFRTKHEAREFVLLHPDAAPDERCIRYLLSVAATLPEYGMFLQSGEREILRATSADAGDQAILLQPDEWGAVLIRREWIERIGGFSEALSTWEAVIDDARIRGEHGGGSSTSVPGPRTSLRWARAIQHADRRERDRSLIESVVESGAVARPNDGSAGRAEYSELHRGTVRELDARLRTDAVTNDEALMLLLSWGQELLIAEQWEGAKPVLAQAAAIAPYHRDVHALLAVCELRLGQAARASHHALLVLRADPNHQLAREILSLLRGETA